MFKNKRNIILEKSNFYFIYFGRGAHCARKVVYNVYQSFTAIQNKTFQETLLKRAMPVASSRVHSEEYKCRQTSLAHIHYKQIIGDNYRLRLSEWIVYNKSLTWSFSDIFCLNIEKVTKVYFKIPFMTICNHLYNISPPGIY